LRGLLGRPYFRSASHRSPSASLMDRRMAQPASTSPHSAKPERPPGGYTVLVVDDEEAVRRLARRMLTWTGYQALEASHGREAIATIEQHAGAIHLVLTDIKMPGMNGRELGRHVEQRWPGKPSRFLWRPVVKARALGS
jgi:PleD family two-component response regulator